MERKVKHSDETGYYIAVYGSLRLGEYNQRAFSNESMKHIGTSELSGYSLHSLGSYPGILPSKVLASKVVVDIFKVDSLTHARIHRMEIGAGYYAEMDTFTINDQDYEATYYTYSNQMGRSLLTVESGDWSKYLREAEEKDKQKREDNQKRVKLIHHIIEYKKDMKKVNPTGSDFDALYNKKTVELQEIWEKLE
jgi:gamma-glutamylcyclotransferase (GGCT)/AIG2-like uncharacterized protein YtfP